MSQIKVAALVGSLRSDSINLKLVRALARLAKGKLEFDIVSLAELPMYNDDLFTPEPPSAVAVFKQRITEADAVLFAMPEYNRSVPAVLKNAIDWGSRPYGRNVWAGKPAATVGSSPGQIGSAVGQAHLRNVLLVLDMGLMGQPEVYIKYTEGLFTDSYEVADADVRRFLEKFVDRFVIWIERFREPPADTQPGLGGATGAGSSG